MTQLITGNHITLINPFQFNVTKYQLCSSTAEVSILFPFATEVLKDEDTCPKPQTQLGLK